MQYNNYIYNYTKRREVAHTMILLPPEAPSEFYDRQTLWSAAEKAEDGSTRWKTARTAKEIVMALPRELTLESQIIMVRDYVMENFVALGICADIAIHYGHKKHEHHVEADHLKIQSHNPHAHILLKTRSVNRDGFGPKAREWEKWHDSTLLRQWREQWANIQNRTFERKGLDAHVDHRSYKERGIDRIPTKHLGPEVAALERRGIHTPLGDENRAIEVQNRLLKEQEERQREQKRERERDRNRIRGR